MAVKVRDTMNKRFELEEDWFLKRIYYGFDIIFFLPKPSLFTRHFRYSQKNVPLT